MRRAAAVLSVLLLTPTPGWSNSAFRLRHPLDFDPASANMNWVSLPYFFFPNGNVGQPGQNSIDLCTYLNRAPLSSAVVPMVGRWETALSRMRFQPCSAPIKAFDLEPGIGYAVVSKTAGTIIDLVGSHDNGYVPSKGGMSRVALQHSATSTNLNWISLPYNMQANNSLDLCLQANGGPVPTEVESISKLRQETWTTQDCASATKAFDAIPGESYAYVPAKAGVALGWEVYECGSASTLAVLTGDDVRLFWSPQPLASMYDIYRESARQNCTVPIFSTPTTEFVDTGARISGPPIYDYGVVGR